MSLSDLYICNNELSADTEIVLIDEVVYFYRKIICIRTVYANPYQVKVVPL